MAKKAANAFQRSEISLASDEAVRQRCKRLRLALGYEQSMAFARAIGVSPQRWSNIEIGIRLSNDVAMKIVSRFHGVSLDWLYRGIPASLSVDLAVKLGELPAPPSKTTSSPP